MVRRLPPVRIHWDLCRTAVSSCAIRAIHLIVYWVLACMKRLCKNDVTLFYPAIHPSFNAELQPETSSSWNINHVNRWDILAHFNFDFNHFNTTLKCQNDNLDASPLLQKGLEHDMLGVLSYPWWEALSSTCSRWRLEYCNYMIPFQHHCQQLCHKMMTPRLALSWVQALFLSYTEM